MEILTKGNLGQKQLPLQFPGLSQLHPLIKGNQVSLVRIHFSHPESDGNRRWGWGSNRDPDCLYNALVEVILSISYRPMKHQ